MTEAMALQWTCELPDSVTCLSWQSIGERLAAGAGSGEVYALGADGGSDQFRLPRAEGAGALSLEWSATGEHLAIGRRDGSLHLLGAKGLKRVDLGGWISSARWAPGRPVVAATAGQDIYLVHLDGRVLKRYPLEAGFANEVAWSQDGEELMVAGPGGVRFYATEIEESEPASKAPSTGTVLTLKLSPDGRLLAAGKLNGSVDVWNLATGVATTLSGSEGGVQFLSWSSDGSLLAVAAFDELTVWQISEGEFSAEGLTHLPVPDGPPGAMAFHPWLNVLVWGGPSGRVGLWSPESNERPMGEITLTGDITCAEWSPLGDRLAVGTCQGAVACALLI